MVSGVKLKELPSKRPLSLSLSEGMTSKAINERVIKGEWKVEPSSLDF